MDEKTQNATVRAMNDELLKKEAPEDSDEKPKRNSKEFLIARIVQLADENDLELTMSTTKLKRCRPSWARCARRRSRRRWPRRSGRAADPRTP